MKKTFALITCACLVLSFVACTNNNQKRSPSSPTLTTLPTEDPSAVEEALDPIIPMYAIALPTVKETIAAEDGTPLLSISCQKIDILLHNSQLEDKINDDLQSRTETLLSNASHFEAQARLDYNNQQPWSEYFIDISYTPTRLDQSVLSLFGNTSSYSGGPHPSLATKSVTYNLKTGDVVYLDDILTQECTADKLYQLILKALETRAENLYYDYADALGNRFTGELHSIQDWYFSQSGLCFHFAPYDIGPYSSGTVIAELPYSTLSGILKDNYFPSNLPPATGSVYAETFIEDDSERFNCIADIALCEAGYEVLLYPDATVTDLRIESGSLSSVSNQYIAGATVFAASTVNVGDAIHLTANLNDKNRILRLVYHSGDQEYSACIIYDDLGDSILLTNG